jgi:hypothetical protein
VLSELRALDRVPQIDLVNEVHKMLNTIHESAISKRIENMVDEYNAKEHKNSLSYFSYHFVDIE